MKSDKVANVIQGDIEYLIEKDAYANNAKTSSTTNVGEHFPCRFSMSIIWAFNNLGNKHTLYRGSDCMKNFCETLREHWKI